MFDYRKVKTALSHLKNTPPVFAAYVKISQDPEYCGYSPLLCAVYDGDIDNVRLLLDYYEKNGNLRRELAFVSPENETHENILHVAMKNPEIFTLVKDVIKRIDHNLLETHLAQPDVDGDTFFHQLVEFGREETLDVFMNDADCSHLVRDAIQVSNNLGETPLGMSENFTGSLTVKKLIEGNVLVGETLEHARQRASGIQDKFASLSGALKQGM